MLGRPERPGGKMLQFWEALWSDDSGQTLTEYALIIELVSVALTLIAVGIASGVLVRL